MLWLIRETSEGVAGFPGNPAILLPDSRKNVIVAASAEIKANDHAIEQRTKHPSIATKKIFFLVWPQEHRKNLTDKTATASLPQAGLTTQRPVSTLE